MIFNNFFINFPGRGDLRELFPMGVVVGRSFVGERAVAWGEGSRRDFCVCGGSWESLSCADEMSILASFGGMPPRLPARGFSSELFLKSFHQESH